ncbi:MAG: (Fe-S)-binding protein [Planctomycetota bacterium]|nr:(Fe-S)-binding protein [Planctomycetota bacterium]
MQVGLFITCLTDTFYPRVGAAVVAVLRHFGCTVRFPPEQTCCGQPAYNNGLTDEARILIERLADIFEPDERVVCPSASCTAMVKRHGPGLFAPGGEARRRAETLAGKIFDFNTFLFDVLGAELDSPAALRPGAQATLHYPCHCRGLITAATATDRARGVVGEALVPLERADQCCGFGGAFAMEFQEISDAMLADKLACLEESGADLLICDESGCRMNIEGGLHRRGRPVRVAHTAELVAEALDLPLPEVS